MSGRYNISPTKDNKGYEFITSSGSKYLTYFTEFILTDSNYEEVKVISVSFICSRTKVKYVYDKKVESTVVSIIFDFFKDVNQHSILYICLNNDGSARGRGITFSRWFNKVNVVGNYEMYKSSPKYASLGFYSALIVKNDYTLKQYVISAYYHTIDIHWGLSDEQH